MNKHHASAPRRVDNATTQDALVLAGLMFNQFGHIGWRDDNTRIATVHSGVGLWLNTPRHSAAELFQILLGGELILTPERGVWFAEGQLAVACADVLLDYVEPAMATRLRRFITAQRLAYTTTPQYNAMFSEEISDMLRITN
jgi:hypothetical protein